MKTICELNDQLILGIDGRSEAAPRLTARAIVKSADDRYAVMYSPKFNLYSLPGGGVEDGEDVLTALKREVYEETGCICTLIEELGIVYENRASLDYTQKNFYYVVTVESIPEENHLTESELANCTEVQWHDLETAYRLITKQQFDRIQGKYLHARDIAALNAYKR